jgi:hypothetical protein
MSARMSHGARSTKPTKPPTNSAPAAPKAPKPASARAKKTTTTDENAKRIDALEKIVAAQAKKLEYDNVREKAVNPDGSKKNSGRFAKKTVLAPKPKSEPRCGQPGDGSCRGDPDGACCKKTPMGASGYYCGYLRCRMPSMRVSALCGPVSLCACRSCTLVPLFVRVVRLRRAPSIHH